MKTLVGYANQDAIFVSEGCQNRHIAVLGSSGCGKTSQTTMLAIEAARRGELVLMLNTHQCLNVDTFMEPIREQYLELRRGKIDISKGIKMSIFQKKENETDDDVIERVTLLLGKAGKLTPAQRTFLGQGVESACKNGELLQDGIIAVKRFLDCQKDRAAKNVSAKLRPILNRNLITDGPDFFENASGIWELDFRGFQYEDQDLLAELIIDYLFRKAQTGAFMQKPVRLVIDECQNLDFSSKGVMCTLINESRKLGLALIISGTEMKTKMAQSALEQCGTVLYFNQPKEKVSGLARKIAPQALQEWRYFLTYLKVGECAAVGEFVDEVGNSVNSPIIIDSLASMAGVKICEVLDLGDAV